MNQLIENIIMQPVCVDEKTLFLSMAKIYFKELNSNFSMGAEFADNFLESSLRNENSFIDFILLNSSKIGFVRYSIEKHFYRNKLIGKIDDIFVDKNSRNAGVARAVATRIQDFFQGKGVEKVLIEIVSNNETAKKFWSKIGYSLLTQKYELKI